MLLQYSCTKTNKQKKLNLHFKLKIKSMKSSWSASTYLYWRPSVLLWWILNPAAFSYYLTLRRVLNNDLKMNTQNYNETNKVVHFPQLLFWIVPEHSCSNFNGGASEFQWLRLFWNVNTYVLWFFSMFSIF